MGLTTISRLCRSYYFAAIGGNFASSSRECGIPTDSSKRYFRTPQMPSYRRQPCVHPNVGICVSVRKHLSVAVRRATGETYGGCESCCYDSERIIFNVDHQYPLPCSRVPNERYNRYAPTELNFNYHPISPAFRWRSMSG
ncbi:MAG: hypothetical protein NC248_07665 [Bacteroides sp.]|nr:hypothetical protein [Bacteroides sp.]MCM1389749.1 hypothetical protein [Bacteroides sp.]